MEERSPTASPKVGTFQELEALASRQLLTCRSLARAVSSTVAVLSDAGSGLQRGSNAGEGDTPGGGCSGNLLEARLQEEDALTAGAGRVLVSACGSLGVALVSLAATLSGDVITPLEDMQNVIEIDRRRSRAELIRLQQQAKMCSNAVSETQLRKEKALEELQSALAQSEAAGEASKASQGGGGAAWLRAPWAGAAAARPDEAAKAAESKIMQAASMQTAIAEELGLREDAETEARLRAEAGSRDFQLRLRCVDFARKSLLQSLLGRCAAAWDDAAHALQAVAEQLRIKAGELSTRKPRMPKSTSAMPDWVVKAAAAAAAEEEKRRNPSAQSPVKVSSPARKVKEEGAGAENGEHALPKEGAEAPAPEEEAGVERTEEENGEKPNASVETFQMQKAEEDSAAALPGSKESLAKEWQRLQARDLELLQRESALQILQDNLEEQQAMLLERRRTLARDQALSMSMLENDSPDSAQVFAIDSSPGKASAAQHGESGGSAGSRCRDDCGNSVEEEDECQDEDQEVDAVWDMDWAHLPSSPNRAGSSIDLAAPAVEIATGQTADDKAHLDATPTRPLASSNGTAAAAEVSNPVPLKRTASGSGLGTDDKSTDASELQRKLEERRRRSDENNGKENGASKDSPVRKIDKGRMPGVHPKMAEKLEERRRRLDAEELAEGTQPAGTSAPGPV